MIDINITDSELGNLDKTMYGKCLHAKLDRAIDEVTKLFNMVKMYLDDDPKHMACTGDGCKHRSECKRYQKYNLLYVTGLRKPHYLVPSDKITNGCGGGIGGVGGC